MTISRYSRTPVLGLGQKYGTSYYIPSIRENINNGNIRYDEAILDEAERLDVLAGEFYGDGRLWWVICAASGIGFSPQVPAGTRIIIPNIEDLSKYVS